MIHKHIFVHAKPGMSEQDFFTYWKDVHAVRYGKKIKQAKGYLINTRVPFGPEQGDPPFQGVAEVWVENVEDELAFAQSKEYLEGSRLDEPNFLAWWQMFALDTTDDVVVEPPVGDWPGVKVFVVTKRKPGMSLDEYRTYGREVHAKKVAKLPGLRGYVICRVNDGHYAVGESLLDTVSMLWFDSTDAIASAQQSDVFKNEVAPDLASFVDQRYFHVLVTEGHWVTRLGGGS
jgi:uncharacterized protein (TIGR02118 family)